jgi:hypothetical protein
LGGLGHDPLGAGRTLHWFLQEQREEVSSMSALLSVVERAPDSNILLREDYLWRNPVGDQREAKNAPPAAGRRALASSTAFVMLDA